MVDDVLGEMEKGLRNSVVLRANELVERVNFLYLMGLFRVLSLPLSQLD